MPVKPIPDGYHAVTPYLIVADAQKLIDFLTAAFGAELRGQMMRPDGKIWHTEMKIGDSVIMLAESMPNFPALVSMLYIYVEDVDATFAKAIAAGATSIRPPEDQFYGDRSGGVTEPCGNTIWIGTHIEDVPDDEIRRRAAAKG